MDVGCCGLPSIYARPGSGINLLRNLRVQFFRYVELLPVGEHIASVLEIAQQVLCLFLGQAEGFSHLDLTLCRQVGASHKVEQQHDNLGGLAAKFRGNMADSLARLAYHQLAQFVELFLIGEVVEKQADGDGVHRGEFLGAVLVHLHSHIVFYGGS